MLVFQVSFLRSELFSLFFSILSIDSLATSNAIKNAVLGEQGWDFKSKKNLRAHLSDKDIKVALQSNKLPFFPRRC